MEFLFGFLGAVIAVCLLLGGVALGWVLREKMFAKERQITAGQLTEAEKRRLREEQEAWTALHNYSVEDAYGIYPKTSDKE
jgi:hypothetical protein